MKTLPRVASICYNITVTLPIICPLSELIVLALAVGYSYFFTMLIFKDIFTDDELASDSFPLKLVDNLIYEFKGRQVVRKEGEILLDGANPSAEDEDEGSEEHVERGIDIVLNHRLIEMNCYEDAGTFKSYIKGYMKKIIEHMQKNGKPEAEVNAFKTNIQKWVVSILNKDRFKTLAFFVGENMAEGQEGQVAIVEYRDEPEGEVPYLMLIKEGIVEEKQ
uniref:Translationally-controlled tumor protein homolog n=1 Tax=Panagrellus redivivus TaxID=6233 RepID=A0A7E4W2D4_PANRE